jgi:ABC-2 type transport system permease protein
VKSLTRTPFVAIFQNEVLLNSKRVAPYALMLIFSAAAVMGWGKGPAGALGWATNSDFYIARSLKAFSFLWGLPIFNAVIMGDAVIRDFRLGIDPLIFSKPINRAQYLLGKFFGNFFVLVCCSAAFPLMLIVLQAFHPSRMVVQPAQVLPYFKHFFFFVVITQLMLATLYFAVGALTRNSKIVYGLAICFYPIYASIMVFLISGLSDRWKIFFDLFLLNSGPSKNGFGNSADYLNWYVMTYTPDMIGNRMLLILIAAICLAVVYVRFRITERAGNLEKSSSTLGLSTASDPVFYGADSFRERRSANYEKAAVLNKKVMLPRVTKANEGFRSTLNKLAAALGVEFRLLCTERSLVVLTPLFVCLSILDVAFYRVTPDVSYSATYATATANVLLLFLFGMTVFYTGEAMDRDRELRIEPVLWVMPAPNNVLLLSKFLATLALTFSLMVLVGSAAIVVQLLRDHTPVDLSAYLITYGVILLPTVILMTGMSIALNVLLRNKYLAYLVTIGAGAGLFYLYSIGYNDWLYNPSLLHLWSYADLTSAGNKQATILIHRFYCLAIAGLCLALGHLFFQRKSTKGFVVDGRLAGAAWSLLLAVVSLATAVVTGWTLLSMR